MASARMIKIITKDIARGTVKASSFICLAMLELGEIYIKSFFPPNYSYTKPVRRFLDGYGTELPPKRNFKEILDRLAKQGLAEEKEGRFSLSERGRKIVSGASEKRNVLKKKWDGKYRLVIFDIPETKRKRREWLRGELYLLNFASLQKSVYIGRNPLTRDVVENIRKMNMNDYVNYLLIEKIFDEKKLRLLE